MSGSIVATVSDNVVTDNSGLGGIYTTGNDAKLTASNNSVSGNTSAGFYVDVPTLFRTRGNNIVQDNATNVFGTTVFVAGD